MSLETRLKAAFERVAATIKLRGLPAGGAVGQVLTKASGGDYDASWVTPAAGGGGGGLVTVSHDSTLTGDGTPSSPLGVVGGAGSGGAYTSSNPVPLALHGTPNFLPADRVAGDAGNYRAVGPAFTAPIGADLTYSQVRVPLRNTQAGSANVGKTVVLLQVNIANKSVVKRVTGAVQAGQTEMILAGPFLVPQGQQHGFIVGVLEGDWDTYLNLFYGAATTFTAPNANQLVTFSDNDLGVNVGSIYSVARVDIDRHRTVLLDGENREKGTLGPAFTVATSALRPTVNVNPGDQHFDLMLNKPIWRNAANTAWVDATGATVA